MLMKDFFNLRKSKLLLLTLLAFFVGGVSPAWAQVTEEFSSDGWSDGWSLSAEATESDYYIEYDSSNDYSYPTGRTGVYGQVSSGTTKYIITPVVNGNGSFKFKRRNSSNGSVYVYTYDNGVLSSSPIASNTSKPSSWTTVSFSGVDNMRLAIVLNGRMDNFTYTLGVEASCKTPKNLTASDVTDESATITWDEGEADTWNLRYKAAGDTDYTEVNNLRSATYALTGLDAATTYTVEVQTVCSTEDQSAWASVEFTTPLCSPSVQKTISYELTDKYSDGWNGASITITDVTSGVVISTITLASGGSGSGTVALCPNREYSFTWTKGSYDSECGYTIKDVDGNDLFTLAQGSSPVAGSIGDNYSWSNTPVEGAKFAIDLNTFDFGVKNVNDAAEQTFTVTNNGNANLTVSFASDNAEFSVPKYILFTDVQNWGNVNMYYWGGDNSVDWPGVAMENAGTNDLGQTQYRAVLPNDITGIIFNGDGKQTVDITTFDGYEGFYTTGTVTDGKYEVAHWGSAPWWTVAAGESRQFTVKMNTATDGVKSGNITLSYTAVNGSETVISVSGTVLSEGAEVVDFNEAIPSLWTNSGWSISSGAASSSSNGVLTTQKLDFSSETNPFFIMKVKSSSSYASGDQITIEGSTDNGQTWTAFEAIVKSYNNGDFGNSSADYSTIVISIPNTVNKLRFTGKYVLIDEIVGLKFSDNDPKMGIYTDADCTVAAATSVTKEFGFVTEAPEAVTYYIKNDGTGTMTLSKTDVAGITATLDKTSVAAGEKATLTIAMPTENNGGYHGGNVVVTAEGLGDFTVAVSGVVLEEGKFDLDFASQDIPATWTAGNWSKSSSGYAEVGYSSSTMQTNTLVAEAYEALVVEAKQSYTGSYTFGVKYREVGTETWNDLIPAANIGTSWVILAGTIAEAGNYEFQFTGNYTQIRRIYGLSKPNAPEMVIYDGEAVADATYSFGKVTDEADAEHIFTVKNEGKATLTGFAATLSGDNADHYTVAIAGATGDNSDEIAAGATATITVTQLKDNLGSHSATLTISATDLDNKEIALSGTTVDHTILNVDFDTASEWPAEILEHGANWTIYNYNGSGEARQNSTSAATSLILTPFTVADATNKLTFDVAYYNYSSYRELTVSYTTDGGITWKDYNWGTEETPVTDLKENIGYSYANQEITGIPAGIAAFKFTGKSIKMDNIAGDMKVTTAPLVAFTTTEDNISGKNLTADATATYTLNNYGNADYVATVAATDVEVAATGEDVTFEDGTLTVPAGKTATITVTMTYAAPYGEKTGSLAITSEDWVGDMTVNYTAEAVDPTDFVIDFEDNAKPAGWYSESWTYNTGAARIYTGTAKPMITELVGAEEGKNVLSFDAKAYNGDDQTLNVYTSADRKTWSEAQAFTLTAESQTFSIGALADGSYYVKFEASNAIVDNIKGVKKLDAPEHDLYYVSATWPTGDVTPGKSYSVSVNVASLRAEETVTAQLFFGETVLAEQTEQVIANGATKTFTLTGTAPAAGTYDVYAKVFNADGTVETEHQSVTVEDTRYLNITAFTRTSETSVVADENNEFTATFNVTVQNTGTASLSADEVSVSLTDGTNAYQTVTWTTESSDVLYMNTSNGTDDIAAADAQLAVWMWGKSEGEWASFTKINDGFYSVALNGNTNFIVVRTAPDKKLSLDDCWNKTGDMSLTGNLIKFTSYNGSAMNFNTESMGYLEPTMSTTLKVSVKLSAGEGGAFTFYAKENVSGTRYFLSQSVNVTKNVATGVSRLLTDDELEGLDIYNLQGQRVEKTAKGLLIINGKKVVRK